MTTTAEPTTKTLTLHTEIDPESGEIEYQAWRCPCGSDEFTYDESHPSSRSQNDNRPDGISFDGDFEWYDGDDTPGVVCASCNASMDVPAECEIDFS